MSDNPFPSGPWTGFFNYTGPEDRHRMDLRLTFQNGRMTGDGADCVGPFVIEGSYDQGSQECQWRKTYVAAHTVHYSGFADGNGIWGHWIIRPDFKGGFHIWPLTDGVPVSESLSEESGVEVTASSPATATPDSAP